MQKNSPHLWEFITQVMKKNSSHKWHAGVTCYLCVSHRGVQPYMQWYYLILEVEVVPRPGETTLSWLLISWFNSRRMPQFCCMEKNCKKPRYRCSKLGRRTHMLNTRNEVSCGYMQQKQEIYHRRWCRKTQEWEIVLINTVFCNMNAFVSHSSAERSLGTAAMHKCILTNKKKCVDTHI